MLTKTGYRILFALLILVSGFSVATAYASSSTGGVDFAGRTQEEIMSSDQQVVQPRDGITVIATDSNSWLGKRSTGPRARAELVAFNPNGTVLYYNDTYTRYWDVDPVPGTTATVEYMFADHQNASACPTEWNLTKRDVDQRTWENYQEARGTDACTRNGFERVNLTTGEVTTLWSRVTPGKEATRYHDADRINQTHIAVADIYLDRVFVVNTETGETTWSWNASSAYDTANTGGPFPEDWTHINDLELLEDGRIMVSVRNHDRAIFIEPGQGLLTNQTLGREDEYGILYEQHNPDHIPKSQGGPAVIVADSENNRVVEYQREDGQWNQSWVWQDARMQWPRDADRLPNGHTLITDSNGNRVFEVNKNGTVVWSTKIAFPYESERLGTGDESSSGPSATNASLESNEVGLTESFWIGVKDILPGKYLNGFMYITPTWVTVPVASALLMGVLTLLVWVTLELYWGATQFRQMFPIK